MTLRAILIGAVGAACAAPTAALGLNYGVEADVVSDYVWRGMVFSPGFVLEPYAYVSAAGITPALWANVQLEDEYNTLDEVDFMISYGRPIDPLYLELGYVYYYLPPYEHEEPAHIEGTEVITTDPTDTHDVFLIAAYSPLPILTVYSDHYLTAVGNPGGYYVDVGVGTGHAFGDALALDAYFEVGVGNPKFNDYNMNRDKAALNLVETGVSVTACFLGVMYVRPHVSYTTLIDGDLREAAGEDNESFWFGGAAVGIEG